MDKSFIKEKSVCLGEVYREHGIKGELKVYIYHEEGEGLKKNQDYYLELGSGEIKKLTLAQVRPASKFYLVKFKGIQYRDEAEVLRKAKIWVEKDSLSSLEEDEFYLNDILGFQMIHKSLGSAGTLISFEDNTAQVLMVIQYEEKQVLIPYIEEWIDKVDFDQKEVHLSCPEELFQL